MFTSNCHLVLKCLTPTFHISDMCLCYHVLVTKSILMSLHCFLCVRSLVILSVPLLSYFKLTTHRHRSTFFHGVVFFYAFYLGAQPACTPVDRLVLTPPPHSVLLFLCLLLTRPCPAPYSVFLSPYFTMQCDRVLFKLLLPSSPIIISRSFHPHLSKPFIQIRTEVI